MTLAAVVPTYNHASHIRATLDSLLAQTVPFDEIVVSENHCTDETAAVLAEYGGAVRVVRPARHLPMSEHWNFACSAVRSSWAILLSSDDIAAPTMSEVLRSGIGRRSDAVYVRGAHDLVDAEGARIARRYLLSLRTVTTPPRTLLEQLEGPKALLSASAVRLDAWRAVGGFPEDLNLLADWGLWIRLATLGTFIYERTVVASYRTGHQEHLAPERVLPYVRDLVFLYETLIPEALAAAGLAADDRHFRQASKRRFTSLLVWLSVNASEADRAAAVPQLERWARRAGCTPALTAMSTGARVAPELARPLARRIGMRPLRAAYTWWRG